MCDTMSEQSGLLFIRTVLPVPGGPQSMSTRPVTSCLSSLNDWSILRRWVLYALNTLMLVRMSSFCSGGRITCSIFVSGSYMQKRHNLQLQENNFRVQMTAFEDLVDIGFEPDKLV
jgi:hypothetical protein